MTMCSAFEKKRVSAGTRRMGMVKCEMPGQQQAYSIPLLVVCMCVRWCLTSFVEACDWHSLDMVASMQQAIHVSPRPETF